MSYLVASRLRFTDLFWVVGCLDGPLWVKITRLGSNESLLRHGDTFLCESDGNPSPKYTWVNANTGETLHNNQQLTFDACRHLSRDAVCTKNNGTITIRCVATVSGKKWTHSDYTNTTFFVDLRRCNQTCGMTASSSLL